MKRIKFKLKPTEYYDPATGKKLKSIEGRRNRPGIDEFKDYRREYPKARSNPKTKRRIYNRNELILDMDISQSDVERIKLEDSEFEPQEINYVKPVESGVTR